MSQPSPATHDGQGKLSRDTTADIVVFSRKWNLDRAGEGDDYNASIFSRILINGVEVPWAAGVAVKAGHQDFTQATLDVLARSVRFIPLDDEDWKREDLSGYLDPKVATVHVALEQAAPEFVRASLALLEAVDVQVMGRGSYAPLIEAAARLKEAFTKGVDAKGSEPEAGRS